MNKTVKTLLLTAGASLAVVAMPFISSHAAQADTNSAFTEEQKAELENLFKQYLSENPELIMESVKNFQERQEQEATKTAQERLKEYQKVFSSDNMPLAGNPDGDVTVVEFFDYNCGYCKKAYSDIMKLIETDKNVRVVFQDFPILSPSSKQMAELSLAAQKQGKYFELHKVFMEYRGPQNEESFLGLAKEVGLDIEQLKKDASGPDVKAALEKVREMGQALGVRGTPGFIVGDQIFPGYIGDKGLEASIKDARDAIAVKDGSAK